MHDVPQALPAALWRPAARRARATPSRRTPSGRRSVLTAGLWLLTVALVVGYVVTPDAETRQWWFAASSLLSVTAFSVGVASARGLFRRDWTLMLSAVYIWAGGQVLRVADLTGQWAAASWRAIAVLSLVASVLMALGTTRLARRDGLVEYATMRIDSVIYVIGTALCWWVGSLRELSWVPELITSQALSANLAPLGDAVMLVGAAALASSRTSHALSSRALVLFGVTGLVGDVAFAHVALRNHDILSTRVPVFWMLQFALAATAALASTRAHTAPRSRMSVQSSTLVMAAAAAPGLLALYCAIELGTSGDGDPQSALAGPVPVHPRTFVVVAVGTAIMAWLVILRSRRLVTQIEALADRMEQMARTDALTQVANRRAGERILGNALRATSSAAPSGSGLHLAFLDLDHFKHYNDSNGHQAGDRLLVEAARNWSSVLGDRGTIFRYGGEEFAVILPSTTLEEARAVVEEMRRVTPDRQTFSGGLAPHREGDDVDSLFARADAALYRAKDQGRARTLVAP